MRTLIIAALLGSTLLHAWTYAHPHIILTTAWKTMVVLLAGGIVLTLARSNITTPLLRLRSPWIEVASTLFAVNAGAWFMLSIARSAGAFNDRAIYAYLMALYWSLLVGRGRTQGQTADS